MLETGAAVDAHAGHGALIVAVRPAPPRGSGIHLAHNRGMPAFAIATITLAPIVTACLLGSLSRSLWCECLRSEDARTQGSGNARRLFACAAVSPVLSTHRDNLQRLRAGSESRFGHVRLLRRRA